MMTCKYSMGSRDLIYNFSSLVFGATIIISSPKPSVTECLVVPELTGKSMSF